MTIAPIFIEKDANHRYARIEASDLFNNHNTGFA